MNRACILLALLLSHLPAQAVCKLPIPDGGGVTPSAPNIFGTIERIDLPYVFIRNGRTNEVQQVSVAKIGEVYSVYGGDAPLSDLKPKLQTWIWFEGCKRPLTVPPLVAYFQIFSSDPNDRATVDQHGRIVAVPRK